MTNEQSNEHVTQQMCSVNTPINQYVDFQATSKTELKTLEWWTSRSMLDLLFFLISRLNNACSPHVINLQIN